ncbi:hypothetical protein BGZ75_004246 [Mortierella antarctica]|nr:hypothetical protein BGZ75_004246 [Mortierella antarctica]
MGNIISRRAHPGGLSRKQEKKHRSRSSHCNLFSSKSNNSAPFPGHGAPNDSGHYSLQGSMAPVAATRPDYAVGSFHTHALSTARLDQHQHQSSSDARLQHQYGSRVKRTAATSAIGGGGTILAADPGSGTVATGAMTNNPISSMNATQASSYNPSSNHDSMIQSIPLRGTGYSGTAGVQEMVFQQREGDVRPCISVRRPSQGRAPNNYAQHLSQHPSQSSSAPQQQFCNASGYPSTAFSQFPYQHMSNGPAQSSPNAPAEAGLSLVTSAMKDSAVRQQKMKQPQRDYVETSYATHPSAYQYNGQNSGHHANAPTQSSYHPQQSSGQTQTNPESRKRNDYGYPIHGGNMNHSGSAQPHAALANGSSSLPRALDTFAHAGPLVDSTQPTSSNRVPVVDQVFALLSKQNPTNPRETDKRERIYRWMDDVVGALTFNPNTNIPGWIIPVVADEQGRSESSYYVDRITFELNLMAPIGKSFRKAIDINCSSGAWAMDMALRYPKTTVYAVDPLLDVARLPKRVPENCHFKLRDVKDQEGQFDLVHQRLGAFRTQIMEWTPHFAELGRLTKPGGWIQLAESSGMIVRAGVESLKVNRWVEKAALSSGLNPMQMVEALMPTILGAGLINVECYEYGIPLGDWGGRRGAIAMRSYLSLVESLREEIIEMNRLEDGMFEETISLMKMECVAESAELIMKVICAQKPPNSDDNWR